MGGLPLGDKCQEKRSVSNKKAVIFFKFRLHSNRVNKGISEEELQKSLVINIFAVTLPHILVTMIWEALYGPHT